MDAFEETLRRAGRNEQGEDADVRRELANLTEEHSRRSARRVRRLALPALVIAGGLVLGGVGAFAATQFGPWVVADPDYVVARDWYDVDGDYLGSCESHVTVEHESPEAQAEALRLLGELDLDALQPDRDYVAGALYALGRPDDYSRLIGGDEPDWTTFSGTWADAPADFLAFETDARTLQVGLIMAVHNQIVRGLQDAGLDPEFELTGEGETQCSSDPAL